MDPRRKFGTPLSADYRHYLCLTRLQPPTLPPLPSRLPLVWPQEASTNATSLVPPQEPSPSNSTSANQPLQAASSIPLASVQDLQAQVRDTQSSLESHLERVRVLEEAFAEQEVMKREVKALKEEMEARRLEIDVE